MNRDVKQPGNDLLTVEEVESEISNIYNRVNDMTKIKLKCWGYYANSRARNKHDAIPFSSYTYNLPRSHYEDFVRSGIVDCTDLGGTVKAWEIIDTWYTRTGDES